MTVAHTSAECFHSQSFQIQAKSERERVQEYLHWKGGPTTRREVAEHIHLYDGGVKLERGSVSRAICDLMDEAVYGIGKTPVVELEGTRSCPISGRQATWIVLREFSAGMQLSLIPDSEAA